MAGISVLPENVANQIAAGEVVVRPASVVKELIENSLDAGAANITVSILQAGRKLIEVKDDGSGMGPEDARAAFLRHATSKISSIEDLACVETMGFRGEALAAIASVAKVELITKGKNRETGVIIKADGGRLSDSEEAASPGGTVIRVKELFFNTPARKKFMKADYTEEAHIIEAVTAAALANETASFRLSVDEKEILFFPGKSPLKERLRIIYGRETFDALLEAVSCSDNIKVYGYIAAPSAAKNTRGSQRLFVNRRPVASRRISYAVYEGYSTLLMRGKYPVTALFIDINPSLVDVNVHPAKAEVRFKDEAAVYNMVKKAVASALETAELSAKPRAEGFRAGTVREETAVREAAEKYYGRESGALFESPKVSVETASQAAPAAPRRREFSSIRVLGRIKKTYIVGEDENGLVLIDQHAAHERVLFESVSASITEGKIPMQEMLLPEILEVTAPEKRVIDKNIPLFEKCGFAIEPFGEKEYRISAHPLITRDKMAEPFVREIASMIINREK
ncbi:MAG TPA: DNA mismatch repair endonuclease MutL, partial [bacterium]|nr:DNA mismatch repair endonuclease MutL [bacterium]